MQYEIRRACETKVERFWFWSAWVPSCRNKAGPLHRNIACLSNRLHLLCRCLRRLKSSGGTWWSTWTPTLRSALATCRSSNRRGAGSTPGLSSVRKGSRHGHSMALCEGKGVIELCSLERETCDRRHATPLLRNMRHASCGGRSSAPETLVERCREARSCTQLAVMIAA
jgi:hypothetical protein